MSAQTATKSGLSAPDHVRELLLSDGNNGGRCIDGQVAVTWKTRGYESRRRQWGRQIPPHAGGPAVRCLPSDTPDPEWARPYRRRRRRTSTREITGTGTKL